MKRIATLTHALALLLTLFAGCAGGAGVQGTATPAAVITTVTTVAATTAETNAPSTTAAAVTTTATELVRPPRATTTFTPVDMGPFTNAAGVNTGSIQVEDLGIDMGGENMEYMSLFIWGDKKRETVAAYWENVCEYINQTYNGNIEMQFVGNQEYWGQLRERIDAGDAPDVFTTRKATSANIDWMMQADFDPLVREGALLPLDEYTDSLLARTYAKVDGRLYEYLTVDGSVYGIIQYHRMFQDGWVLYDKFLTETAGVEIGPWTHYSDLWEPLIAMREWTDANLPDRHDTAMAVLPIDWVQEGGFGMMLSGVNGCIGLQYAGCERVAGKAAETEAFNLYDCPEFVEYLKNVSQLVTDRVLREGDENYLNAGALNDVLENNANFVMWYEWELIVPPQEMMLERPYDKSTVEWVLAPRSVTLPDYSSSIYRLTVISADTESPEAACGLIEILNNDLYVGTTLRFGIEGKSWMRVEDGRVNRDYGSGNVTSSDSPTMTGFGDDLGDITNRLIPRLVPLNLADILSEGHARMIYSSNVSFQRDFAAVQAERSAVSAVLNEYLTDQKLYSGRMTPAEIDETVTEFIEKLNAAGADRIRAEVQRQLDEWRAGR